MEAALVILDGWGLGDGGGRDAVASAETPVFDELWDNGATGQLQTAGRTVGLPEGQMGNSEVGHLTIGAGRVVPQESTRIEDAIAEGALGAIPAIEETLRHVETEGGRLHLVGLVSDGGVHAHQRHLHALLEVAADRDVAAVTHAITDGRDTAPSSGLEFLGDLEDVVERVGTGAVATVTGRYYAMDRDQNWERTARAYDAIVERRADHVAPSATAAIEAAYDRGETDEFVEPTVIADRPALADGDAVLWWNFRADRARQLTRMLAGIDPEWPERRSPPSVRVTTMTEYDRTFDLPVALDPMEPDRPLGAVLADAGLTQLRIAESEKYPHVTYFLNGGREVRYEGERREIVSSPDVPTYDEQPEMSAPAVTDTAVRIVDSADPDVLVLNYANPDMVGHTGDFDAAVRAVETVDTQLGRLIESLRSVGSNVLVTADHGNAEDMGTPEAPHTAHTLNDVPIVHTGPADVDTLSHGTLADVTPTLLSFCGVETPPEMTGTSLLRN